MGCGGGNEDTSTPSSSDAASKAQFVAAANKICAEKGKAIQAEAVKIIKTAKGPAAKEQKLIAQQAVIPNLEAEIDALRKMGAPSGDSGQVEHILAAIEDTVSRLSSASPVTVQSSFKANHPYRPGEEIAASYGLTACGHP
jgi:hypothetical protein